MAAFVAGRLALADFSMDDTTWATMSVWTRNLFDEAHVCRRSNANALVLGDDANFNPPRTFRLAVSVAMGRAGVGSRPVQSRAKISA